jgi:hypothetical protein
MSGPIKIAPLESIEQFSFLDLTKNKIKLPALQEDNAGSLFSVKNFLRKCVVDFGVSLGSSDHGKSGLSVPGVGL